MWKKEINIIQFMPYFPPHKWWLETVWEEIWKYWVKNNMWKFINIVTNFNQKEELEKNEKIVFDNKIIWYKKNWYEVLICPSIEIINNFPVYKIWSKEYRIIKKYLNNKILEEKNNFRIITHTRFFLTSLIWWLFARKNKIKWIHIEHWSDYVKLSSKIKTQLSIIYDKSFWKWIFKKTDKILAISEACKKFIKKEFVDREVEVFYRGVELINLEEIKKWEIKLVFIWRLVKLKWVDILLKAYLDLWIKNKLIIIGDWEEKQNLENFCQKNNLNQVEFLWFKNKNYINKFLVENKCILINPSYQEGLPTSVIEWLFYKNIVIASNVWWTVEISNKPDLILFEAWNIKKLKEKILFWIINFDKYSWLSKKIIQEKFNWDENIKNIYNLLKKWKRKY